MTDPLENKRKQLIFRSGHRGTKEMDLLLGSFAQKHVPDFTEDELEEYAELLNESDPDLYNWMTGQEEAPMKVQVLSIFGKVQAHRFEAS